MPSIDFEATVSTIEALTLVHLPLDASQQLPSRGMVMVNGTIAGHTFQAPLEPDGKGSHWLKLDTTLQRTLGLKVGDTITASIEPTKDWPEPVIPEDLQHALDDDSEASAIWRVITPMARWDWIRWINGTGNPETRRRRIEVACSKMRNGSRRPCCFNRSECTDPSVSKNGVLLGLV